MTRRRSPTRPRSRRGYLVGTGAVLANPVLAGCIDGSSAADDESPSDRSDDGGDEPATEDDQPADGDGHETDDAADGDDTTDETPVHETDETAAVCVLTSEGDELGSVTAAIADTPVLRRTGLSETPSLPEDRGMLFVYADPGDRTFVMREMDFGIDIVYADADGVITEIHHAPEPESDEDGADQEYDGYGQYVLEVGYGWTADRDVETGDVLAFEV